MTALLFCLPADPFEEDSEAEFVCRCHALDLQPEDMRRLVPVTVNEESDCLTCETNWSFGNNDCTCPILAADGTVIA